MSRTRVKETFDKNLDYYNKIFSEFHGFLSKDTYLTYSEKMDFINRLIQLRKLNQFPWYSIFFLRLRKRISEYHDSVDKLRADIQQYNSRFVEKRLLKYEQFFSGEDDNLKYPLDLEQRKAIIKDDKHNLVIAAAGSGKTSVIASRIAYLIRREDNIAPERVLAIAFTKVAAQEMKKRIKNNYNIDIEIRTFHALGRKIIKEETGKTPRLLFKQEFEKSNYNLISQLFSECSKSSKFRKLLVDYYTYHLEQELSEDSFIDKEEYYLYMKNKKYRTLNDIEVKSMGEADIANFFFIHNIDFKYEPLVNWVDQDDNGMEEQEYHPDFYLPEYDVYIEFWGLNRDNEVPAWFSITSEKYNEIKDWKLQQFEKHTKKIVQTWAYERENNTLILNLEARLKEVIPEMQFEKISYEELVEKTYSFKEKRDEITNLIMNFIKIAKSNFYFPKDIKRRLEKEKFTRKQKIFGKIALQVYEKYQDYLESNELIDFNDMINTAVKYVEKNKEKYSQMYDHVLVDEFQDISHQRLQLIKGFVNNHSNTKLFCVGDDFQSIYQFAGSDVNYFTNFGDFFSNPEISYLHTNYRCTTSIVELSDKLISKNRNQINKEVIAKNTLRKRPLFFDLEKKYRFGFQKRIPHVFYLIESLIEKGIKPKEIMVISRFNNFLEELKQFCGANNLSTETKAGGIRFYSAHASKGTESDHVIIVDVNSGLYGFPCEIQDSSVLECAKRFRKHKFIEEERRLFYVALTRSKQHLYIYSIEGENSTFISEIRNHLNKIVIDAESSWNILRDDYLPSYLENRGLKRRIICPKCNKVLIIKQGKNGKFIRCPGFPDCNYIEDVFEQGDKKCPKCGRKLVLRKRDYRQFYGCLGYPKCKYTCSIRK